MALFYNNKETASGLKLIDVGSKGELKISTEGLKVLDSMDPDKKCNLMFIFGRARSGKSFMMNCLAGVRGLFKVVNSSIPCTKGVDISDFTMPHSTLVDHVNGLDAGGDVIGSDNNLGYVDVEGQGDQDGDYDTKLALPLLVTSKIVLFNHKGAPTVTEMLSKLGVLARAAEYIDLGDRNDQDEDVKKFGHLHVLFRDFSFEGTRETVYEQLIGKEKVPKKTPGTKKDKDKKGAADPVKAAKERNAIRDLLTKNFASINVWLFRQPATFEQLQEHKELPVELVAEEFKENIQSMLVTIARQTAEPTLFSGTPMTGPRLATLLGQVATQVNQSGDINVPSVFLAMERETVMKVGHSKLEKCKKKIMQISETIPVAEVSLAASLDDLVQGCLKQFDKELMGCQCGIEMKGMRNEIEVTTKKLRDDVVRDNHEAVLAKISEVASEQMSQMRAEFDAFCEEQIPVEDLKDLYVKFEALKDEHTTSIRDQLKALDARAHVEKELDEQEKNLEEYFRLKQFQNENELKGTAIKQLQEEVVETQVRMKDQNIKFQERLQEEKDFTENLGLELEKIRKEKESLVSKSNEEKSVIALEYERFKREKEELVAENEAQKQATRDQKDVYEEELTKLRRAMEAVEREKEKMVADDELREKRRKTELTRRANELANVKEELEMQLGENEVLEKKSAKEKKQLEEKLAQMREASDELKREKEELTQQKILLTAASKKAKKKLEKELANNEDGKAGLAQKVTFLEKVIKQGKEKLGKVEKELAQERRGNEQLKEENEQLKEENQSSKDASREGAEHLDGKIDQLKQELAEAKQEIARVSESEAAVRKELADEKSKSDAERAKLQETIRDEKKHGEKLMEELVRMSFELAKYV